MVPITPCYRLHRVKTDETVDDTDYLGDAVAPDEADCAKIGVAIGNSKHPVSGIDILIIGTDDAGVILDPGTMTVDIEVIGAFTRSNPRTGGTPGRADGVFALQTEDDASIGKPIYYPLCGAERFFVRVLGDANDAVDRLEIWWVPVYQ